MLHGKMVVRLLLSQVKELPTKAEMIAWSEKLELRCLDMEITSWESKAILNTLKAFCCTLLISFLKKITLWILWLWKQGRKVAL
ncbi:hypothetical protein HN51_062279 [Arachis hypogaea]